MNDTESLSSLNRRAFLARSGAAGLAAAGLSLPGLSLPGHAARRKEVIQYPKGAAEHCIFIWLGGGAAHIDTWDPKRKGDGRKVPGSAYSAIPTAIPNVNVCEHLHRCAPILDRFTLIRTVYHDVIDEHAAAVNRLHTGRPTSGTVVYPSIGSIVSHERGQAMEGVPAYMVMGYPNLTRGPGFLGSRHGYIYLLDTETGPSGLSRAPDVSPRRQAGRDSLLETLRQGYVGNHPGDRYIEDYDVAVGQAGKLANGDFISAFSLSREKNSLRESYGGEFGQRCLLARRLVQSGVRFVEVSFNLNFINGTGWDTHNEGQQNQHILVDQLDRALSSLVLDLESLKRLDRTLIVVATEFGRPPEFDGRGGRGHHSKAFSVVLAGGGLNPGQVVGVTDELGRTIIEEPVSVPDLHATIHCALGIGPDKVLYDGDRPVPVTDMGEPVRRLFA